MELQFTGIDRGFNAMVLHMANRVWPQGWYIQGHSPNTLDDLKFMLASQDRIGVYSGASEHTIYGDPEINYAFRAWHDFHHVTKDLPFTENGEKRVLALQQADVIRLCGHCETSHKWCDILEAEIMGQWKHHAIHGEFPRDQKAFVLDYLRDKHIARAVIF